MIRVMSSSLFLGEGGDEYPGGIWFFQTPACLIQGMQRVKIFFLVHVEGSFYGLIQFVDLAGIARAH